MAVNIIQGGIGYGALVGGTSAAFGWIQNKVGINQWMKPYDSSYALPLFKEALALGAPALIVELGARTVEKIDAHSTKLQKLHPFAFKMTMIALRTFAFVKVAEALSKRYLPIHKKFIYQAAALYALGANDPNLVTIDPVTAVGLGSIIGILAGANSWFSRNIFGDRIVQWFDPTYVSPSFKTAFAFTTVSITITIYALTVLKNLDSRSIKTQKKRPKIWAVINTVLSISALLGVAEVMKKNNYQIHQLHTNFSIAVSAAMLTKTLFGDKREPPL